MLTTTDDYCLDSNVVSALVNGHQELQRQVNQVPKQRIFLNVVSAFENLRGWFAQLNKQQSRGRIVWAFDGLLRTLAFYGQSQVLPFDDEAAIKYEELRRQHRRLNRDDLRIAAIALVQDMILVTQNVRDFADIEGLRVENWLS
jgi:tRNA(fMet)-specific endonuclease VapC